MEKLIEQLLNQGDSSHRRIMKFDRNVLFKGHTGYIYYGEYKGDGTLTFHNRYFDTSINTDYCFKTNKTTITASIDLPTPKYLKNFINTITRQGSITVRSKDENFDYLFNDYFWSITMRYKANGFVQFDHGDNLQIAKRVRNSAKIFRSIVRENGNDSSFCKNVVLYYKDKVLDDVEEECLELSQGLFK